MVGKQLSDSCTVGSHRDWLSSHLLGKSHIHPENWVTFHSHFAPATPHDYETQPFPYPIPYHQVRLDIWEGSMEIRPGVEWRMWGGLLHALWGLRSQVTSVLKKKETQPTRSEFSQPDSHSWQHCVFNLEMPVCFPFHPPFPRSAINRDHLCRCPRGPFGSLLPFLRVSGHVCSAWHPSL